MFVDGRDADLEQLRHHLLSQPDRLLLEANLDPLLAGLGREDQELGGAVADLEGVSVMGLPALGILVLAGG